MSVAREEAVRFVTVRGRRQKVVTSGAGSPLVVFESGCGGSSTNWRDIAAEISLSTRTFAYDRFGCGESDSAQTPRTAHRLAAELHELLDASGERPPLILVGLSFGALVSRAYAQKFRGEVAGLVLLEPAHEDLLVRMPRALVEHETSQWERAPAPVRAETDALDATRAGLHGFDRSLGDLPLVVITATRKWGDLPRHVDRNQVAAVWMKLHEELLSLSTRARHVVTSESGHNVHLDAPSLVVDAITGVVAEARAHSAKL